MSTALTTLSTTALEPEVKTHITSSFSELKPDEIYSVDDLLLSRVRSIPDVPLVAYPVTARGRGDYAHYNAKDLDRFADEVLRRLLRMGLVPPASNTSESKVVALLAPSNLDYLASIFALHRLGFAVLLLSNRLSTEAYIALLKATNCHHILASPNHVKTVAAIQAGQWQTQCYPVLERAVYDLPQPSGIRYRCPIGGPSSLNRIAFIVHSSGSTGLPKPIFQTQKAVLSNYSSGLNYTPFLTLPLYHNHGISSFFRALYSGKELFMFNANLPLSGPNLIEAMEAAKPTSFHGVPYALKLLAESEKGISCLTACQLVMFGGSSCPDELGDRLTEAGVYLVGHYGAYGLNRSPVDRFANSLRRTEMGQLMTSFRPMEDKAWNYLRPLPSVEPYLRFVKRAPNMYECVVLDGLPSKVASNNQDPPNSFNTSDLFCPHPSLPNAWKYLGRHDDRVTLVNGEKVLPVPYEHQVRQHELVKEVCVFGVGRALPGLIVISSENATGLSASSILDTIWPTIKHANSKVEGFSQISRDMVEILPHTTEYPCTDKGTMIRAAFYRKFESLIDSIYDRFERPTEQFGELLSLDKPALETWLLGLFQLEIGFKDLTTQSDFFEAGVDSLQAITARSKIIRTLGLAGKVPSQNVVFEHPNIQSLTEHLWSLRTGETVALESEIDAMADLIQKYSNFKPHVPGPYTPDGDVVMLTGATGSLGAHVLAQLIEQDDIKGVCCLVRAKSFDMAKKRVLSTLEAKGLKPTGPNMYKVTYLPADLSREDLGLESTFILSLRSSLTRVIHCAWAVNFNLGVRSFEQHHIKGTFNLINLCLSVHTVKPARFFFCSSISAAAGTPLPATIEESYIPDLAHAQNMGYARSKLVTEHVIKAAAEKTGIWAQVLRVGQIVGDTRVGIWNSTEAIPLMIRSATTIGALPALEEVSLPHILREVVGPELNNVNRHPHGYRSTKWLARFSNSQVKLRIFRIAVPSFMSRMVDCSIGRMISYLLSATPACSLKRCLNENGSSVCVRVGKILNRILPSSS